MLLPNVNYIDPDNYTAAFAQTEGSKGMGINFSNREWDDLFDTERQNTDVSIREAALEQIREL